MSGRKSKGGRDLRKVATPHGLDQRDCRSMCVVVVVTPGAGRRVEGFKEVGQEVGGGEAVHVA